MKRFIFLIISIISMALLAACGGNGDIKKKTAAYAESTAYAEAVSTDVSEAETVSETATMSETLAMESPIEIQAETEIPSIVSEYIEKYQATDVFQSSLVYMDYLLIGPEHAIYIRAIDGVETVKIMKRAEIERIEDQNVAGYHTMSIYDITGDSISITVDGEEATALQELLS